MKPLPVTAIFGKPSKARSELAACLLESGRRCASIRFSEAGDGNTISRALDRIAAVAGEDDWDHAIIEVDGNMNPLNLAQGFENGDAHGGEFSRTAYLAAIVTMLEPGSFLRCIQPGGLAGEFPQGYRNDVVEQLEASDFIVMEQTDNAADLDLAGAIVHSLNPRAEIAAPIPSPEAIQKILKGRHDLRAAQLGTGWQRCLEGCEGCDGREEPRHGLGAFVYTARRPFHPQRLWEMLRGPLPGVFRAKGFFWVATRMSQMLGMARAGRETRFAIVGQWWASMDREQWPPMPEFREAIEKRWTEPYGDRQQAIVLMGVNADFETLSRSFDACLLDKAEMAAGESGWSALDDPFPCWNAHAHDHHHHEEHGEAEHDHCCGEHCTK